MNENIGNLNVRISADTSDLSKGLESARKGMSDFRQSISPAIKTIGAVAAASAAAATAVVAFTKAASDNARQITALASVANTSSQELQRMSYATRSVGIEQDKLADILKDVNDRVGDFLNTGGGEMADFFEKIAPKVGVTAEQFRNLSGPQSLQLFVSSLEKANISQAEMVFYMESMANDATALVPLLRNNGEGMARMAAEADALGIVLSDLELASLKDFGNEFNRISGIIKGVTNLLAVEMAPILAEIADRITTMAVEAGGFGNMISKGMNTAIRSIGSMLDAFHKVRTSVAGIEAGIARLDFLGAKFAKNLWETLAPVFDGIIEKTNVVIDGFNTLAGTDLARLETFGDGAFMAGVNANLNEAGNKLFDLAWAFEDLKNAELPSDQINKFMDAVEARRQALKDQIEEDGGFIPGLGTGGGMSEEDQKALDKMREQLEQRVEMLRESLLTEREVELERYAEANEDLRAALELELITQQEYDQLKEDNHKHHTDRLTEMDEKAAQRRIDLARQVADQEKRMRQDVANLAIGLLGTLGSENKAFALASIALTKGMAIAQTIAHTQTASMLAYASQLIPGDPSSVARAATAALATQKMGAIKVGLIAATGLAQAAGVMSGGGGSTASGGGGSTGGGGGNNVGTQAAAQVAAPSGGTLTVQGISSNALFTGDSVRALAEELIEYQKRGGTITIE